MYESFFATAADNVPHEKSCRETCDELILNLVFYLTQLTNLYCCTGAYHLLLTLRAFGYEDIIP